MLSRNHKSLDTEPLIAVSYTHLEGYDISNTLSRYIPHNMTDLKMNKEMTKEMLYESVETLVKVCKKLKEYGFDGVFLHSAYRMTLFGRSLSTATNKRTDEFGGSLENRCQMCIRVRRDSVQMEVNEID